MALEIERKFLVTGDGWRSAGAGTPFRQGYLSCDPERTVRVRLAGSDGKLTIKGKTTGISRLEFEYDIPASDATRLLDLCEDRVVEKIRHVVLHAGKTWEVDEFQGSNAGLIVAEIELRSEDEGFDLPDWIGEEVSSDRRYFNAYLCQTPFTTW